MPPTVTLYQAEAGCALGTVGSVSGAPQQPHHLPTVTIIRRLHGSHACPGMLGPQHPAKPLYGDSRGCAAVSGADEVSAGKSPAGPRAGQLYVVVDDVIVVSPCTCVRAGLANRPAWGTTNRVPRIYRHTVASKVSAAFPRRTLEASKSHTRRQRYLTVRRT